MKPDTYDSYRTLRTDPYLMDDESFLYGRILRLSVRLSAFKEPDLLSNDDFCDTTDDIVIINTVTTTVTTYRSVGYIKILPSHIQLE